MRITGGAHRGRRLHPPEDRRVRPTTDRVRESLFNILSHGYLSQDGYSVLDGAMVLDACAGSGALGLEALSRGAAWVTSLDNDGDARALIARNAVDLGLAEQILILPRDATRPGVPPGLRALDPEVGYSGGLLRHDLLLLDPPYGSGLAASALKALAAQSWLASGALCVVEQARDEALAIPEAFEALEQRGYGATTLHFLRLVG